MNLHQIEQGTPEWFELRKLKMTASNAQAIATGGKGLDTYVHTLIAESLSSAEKEHYTNADIERGLGLEEQARSLYSLETGNTVEEVGFVEVNQYSGCSPDGFVADGLIEIKCPNDLNHLKIMLYGEKAIDSKYLWQVQCQMLMTERKHCTLCFYNPNFEKSLIMFRIEADPTKQEKLKAGLAKGEEMIKQILNTLNLCK